MNKKHLHISDHLLAKFLDGKTDAAETEQVLAYLNENNENLEDFMNIRSATQVETECPIKIDLTERLNVVKQHIASSNKKPNRNKFYLITSLAVAAIVVGILSILYFNIINKDYQPVAQQDSSKEIIMPGEIMEKTFPTNLNDKELASNETEKNSTSHTTSKPVDKEEETEIQVQVQHKNTAEKSEENLFEMKKPAKTPYVVLCKNLDRTFDFQWNTNAGKTEIILKDKNGKTILNQEVTQNVFHIKYADYIKYEDIQWELKAIFEDGKTEVRRGVLQLIQE